MADTQRTGEQDAIRMASREVSAKEVEVNQLASVVERSKQKTASQVTAEISGTAVVNEGVKNASSEKALVQILPEDAGIINGTVSEFDFDKIHEGEKVEIAMINSEQKATGVIEEISKVPQAQESSSNGQNSAVSSSGVSYSFKVKSQSPLSVQLGMSVNLIKAFNGLVVPKSALVKEKGKVFVYVYCNGKAVKKTVTLTKTNGVDVIESGVANSEKVIQNPDAGLKDGMKVIAQ